MDFKAEWDVQVAEAKLLLDCYSEEGYYVSIPNMFKYMFDCIAAGGMATSFTAFEIARKIHECMHGKTDPLTKKTCTFPMGRDVGIMVACLEIELPNETEGLCADAQYVYKTLCQRFGLEMGRSDSKSILGEWDDIAASEKAIGQIVYPFTLGTGKPLRYLAVKELETFINDGDDVACAKFLTTYDTRVESFRYAIKIGTTPQMEVEAFVARLAWLCERHHGLLYACLIRVGILGPNSLRAGPLKTYPFPSTVCLPLAYAKHVQEKFESALET